MTEAGPRTAGTFTRCNLFELPLRPTVAHEGTGEIMAVRIATSDDLAGSCRFVDYAEVPPGTSVGFHQHPDDEEEYYLVLDGAGTMRIEDEHVTVTAGDFVRNRGGGRHGLVNDGDGVLRMFIFAVTAAGQATAGGREAAP